MIKEKLLLVEDDLGFREQLKWALADDFRVYEADSLKSALAVFKKEGPGIVCLDMNFENQSQRGLDVISGVLSLNKFAKIIVITGTQDKTLGAKALEMGACDFLPKPVDSKELKVLISRAFRIATIEESSGKNSLAAGGFDEPLILGESSKIRDLMDKIKRLAATDVSVLITGESGTGKELCARAVHFNSCRRNKAFVPINCSAIPGTLLESELFGYVKGAFTGADTDKMGLIQSADQGTLFLDEIGDMPRSLQVKLLRFLEDQKLQRLGDIHEQKLNVRIVAATNKLFSTSTSEGSLRSDLFYRLAEFEIHLPRLQEREGDVLLIADHIIEVNRAKFNQSQLTISKQARGVLSSYHWPGNIRELKNRLNRASLSCLDETIKAEDLEISLESGKDQTLTDTKQLMEKNILERALEMTNNNISQAAKKMGISRPTLYSLMKKYKIT